MPGTLVIHPKTFLLSRCKIDNTVTFLCKKTEMTVCLENDLHVIPVLLFYSLIFS